MNNELELKRSSEVESELKKPVDFFYNELLELAGIDTTLTEEELKKGREERGHVMVQERPIFVVCIDKFEGNETLKNRPEINKLHSVVYNLKSQGINYKIFGRFTNLMETAEGMKDANDAGIEDAYVIGLYMNTITSVKLTHQLMEIYDENKDIDIKE